MTLQLDLMPMSYVLSAGHRVQLTITGADYRERDRDPREEGMQIAVSSGSGSLSSLELPVAGG